MKYESTILKRLIDTYGVVGNPCYISEIIKEFIVQGKEHLPNLFTYQSDWLAHIDEFGLNPTYTVSYTGQSIYAPNTLERPVKSAILKGNTLVNRFDNKCYDLSNWNGSLYKTFYFDNLEVGKEYVFYAPFKGGHTGIDSAVQLKAGSRTLYQAYADSHGTINVKFTLTEGERLHFDNYTIFGNTLKVDYPEILILESKYYYDGISFFTGMKSVQMPVLTTIGKNIIGECINPTEKNKQYKAYLKPNTTYTLSYKNTDGSSTGSGKVYLKNGDTEIASYGYHHQMNFTTPSTTNSETILCINSRGNVDISVLLIEGKVSYTNLNLETILKTPYKSNILTVNEDVTLRSNGSVCDELDLLTGKLTQRIDEDGEILVQEVVKTVDLTILDQNKQNVKQLMSFSGGTHFNTGSLEGSPLPTVSASVETDLEETLKVCSLEGNTL